MPSASKLLAALCGTSILLGCTSSPKTAETTIVPNMRVQHSYESADGYYALGRYFHGAQRYDEAIKAYRQAQSLQPDHVKAGNALAVLYAETGDLRQAADLLQTLSAARPDASHLLSNLGHVYFLDGQYNAARQALEKATALDPGNVHARNNLSRVLEKLGLPQQSEQVVAVNGMGAPGNRVSSTPAAKVKPGPTGTQVRAVGPGMYEVRRAGPIQASSGFVPAPASAAPRSAVKASPVRIEVSNGNGINGMAKSVGKLIESAELKVVRLTNQNRFAVKMTRIEYSAGHEHAARGLADRLGPSIVAMPGSVGPAADVRIVLGKDLPDARTVRANYAVRSKRADADGAQAS